MAGSDAALHDGTEPPQAPQPFALGMYSDVGTSDSEGEATGSGGGATGSGGGAPPLPVTPELLATVARQVEFYFSDANLPTDKKLLKQIRKEPQGFVPIKLFANFRKIRALTKDPEVIASALKDCSGLALSEDLRCVRRVVPVPEYNISDIQKRILVVENLPIGNTIESVTEMFAQYGSIRVVRICSKESRGKLPGWMTAGCMQSSQQHAFVEYEEEQEAVAAVAATYPEDDSRHKLKISLLTTLQAAAAASWRDDPTALSGRRSRGAPGGSQRASREGSPSGVGDRSRATGQASRLQTSSGGAKPLSTRASVEHGGRDRAALLERRSMGVPQHAADRQDVWGHEGFHPASEHHQQSLMRRSPGEGVVAAGGAAGARARRSSGSPLEASWGHAMPNNHHPHHSSGHGGDAAGGSSSQGGSPAGIYSVPCTPSKPSAYLPPGRRNPSASPGPAQRPITPELAAAGTSGSAANASTSIASPARIHPAAIRMSGGGSGIASPALSPGSPRPPLHPSSQPPQQQPSPLDPSAYSNPVTPRDVAESTNPFHPSASSVNPAPHPAVQAARQAKQAAALGSPQRSAPAGGSGAVTQAKLTTHAALNAMLADVMAAAEVKQREMDEAAAAVSAALGNTPPASRGGTAAPSRGNTAPPTRHGSLTIDPAVLLSATAPAGAGRGGAPLSRGGSMTIDPSMLPQAAAPAGRGGLSRGGSTTTFDPSILASAAGPLSRGVGTNAPIRGGSLNVDPSMLASATAPLSRSGTGPLSPLSRGSSLTIDPTMLANSSAEASPSLDPAMFGATPISSGTSKAAARGQPQQQQQQRPDASSRTSQKGGAGGAPASAHPQVPPDVDSFISKILLSPMRAPTPTAAAAADTAKWSAAAATAAGPAAPPDAGMVDSLISKILTDLPTTPPPTSATAAAANDVFSNNGQEPAPAPAAVPAAAVAAAAAAAPLPPSPFSPERQGGAADGAGQVQGEGGAAGSAGASAQQPRGGVEAGLAVSLGGGGGSAKGSEGDVLEVHDSPASSMGRQLSVVPEGNEMERMQSLAAGNTCGLGTESSFVSARSGGSFLAPLASRELSLVSKEDGQVGLAREAAAGGASSTDDERAAAALTLTPHSVPIAIKPPLHRGSGGGAAPGSVGSSFRSQTERGGGSSSSAGSGDEGDGGDGASKPRKRRSRRSRRKSGLAGVSGGGGQGVGSPGGVGSDGAEGPMRRHHDRERSRDGPRARRPSTGNISDGSGPPSSDGKAKKPPKKDYASWAAATPEYRAEAAATKHGSTASKCPPSPPHHHHGHHRQSTSPPPPQGQARSRRTSGSEGGAGHHHFEGGPAAPGSHAPAAHSVHTSKGPDGSRGFAMGRGKPMSPPPVQS